MIKPSLRARVSKKLNEAHFVGALFRTDYILTAATWCITDLFMSLSVAVRLL